MSDEQPAVAVMFEGQQMPKKPRVMPWHWIAYYVYNLARKPKVWRLQREQDRIYKLVRGGLERTVLTDLKLYGLQRGCVNCRNAYGTLKSQAFLSTIRMILKNMRCDEHPWPYDTFLKTYQIEFDRNEQLAAEINGFKR
jgi:hypothetical protein